MVFNPDKYFNPNHKEFFQSTAREILFFGSRGSGKSYSVADKLIYQSVKHAAMGKPTKTLVLRTSGPALKRTCIDTMISRLEKFELKYDYNKIDNVITLPGGSTIMFISIANNSEVVKVKSITDADFLHVEEANELYEDWVLTAMGNLRGGKGSFKQAIMTMNPTNKSSWCYKRYIQDPVPDSQVIFCRTEDNPWIDPEYITFLKSLEFSNPTKYRTDYLGEWISTEGLIYSNWDIVDRVPFVPSDEWYGIDFGFTEPCAIVKINKYDGELYIQEKLYKTKLEPTQLIDIMRRLKIDYNSFIYADSSRPELISELFAAGWKNIRRSKKGPNSIEEGINFVRDYKLHILRDSTNLINEIETYSNKVDRNGLSLDEPVDKDNHLMDAMRYAIHDHLQGHKPKAYGANGVVTKIDPWGGHVFNGVWWPDKTIKGDLNGRAV